MLAERIALPLLLLGAGLALIQPCAGQSGTWTATGSLANAGSRTATLLPNGKVLAAGTVQRHGYLPPTYFATAAELYDPASGTWAPTGIPVIPFHSLTATLLPNGKALVTGTMPLTYSVVAELYDPRSGTWSAAGSLHTARDSYTATLLPNGKVLVVGGRTSDYASLASAELYDPARGTWRATGSLETGRTVTRQHCCPTARYSSQVESPTTTFLSRARNSTIRPTGPGVPLAASPRGDSSHRDAAAQRRGARRRWRACPARGLSLARGTLQSGERDLECHWQPSHRADLSHRDVVA